MENPYNVTPEMERLGPLGRSVSSESMFFQAWDPDQGIGIWATFI